MAINCDGSSYGNPGAAGFGGIIRDNLRAWIIGCNGSIGIVDNTHAELQGIRSGLQLAWNKNYRKIVYFTDSLHAIHLINEGDIAYHRYASLIREIRGLFRRDWEASIKHIFREDNYCADYLAKNGAKLDTHLQILEEAPAELKPLILGDALGIAFMRH
ncbi:Ribonuclease H domain [Sesbania bispinosa]|nr:Ribonuclease H domain [Sesbania bispinosa]